MSAARVMDGAHVAMAEGSDFLGPAEVLAVDDRDVRVERRDGVRVDATLALALPYEPVPGDVLLVIGRGGEHWVIGVIQGSGRTVLSLPGDVDVRAEGGTLRLTGDRGVELAAPEVGVQAGKLRMVAGEVVQRFTSLVQRVSELLHVHAGQATTVVEGSALTRAQSAAIVTEQTVTINGEQIHLN